MPETLTQKIPAPKAVKRGGTAKLEKLRSRYLRDPIPVRLGGLAANLARVASFSKNDKHREVVFPTLQESKWFIEWIAAELAITYPAQFWSACRSIQMAQWQRQSQTQWLDKNWRQELIIKSQDWSQRVLEMSGFVEIKMKTQFENGSAKRAFSAPSMKLPPTGCC